MDCFREELTTLGLSQVGNIGNGGRVLGHVTTMDRAGKISKSGQLIGKAGIYALKRPSSKSIINAIRTAGAKTGTVVPIRGAAATGFRPIPAVGPITNWTRIWGGYLLPAKSLNLASGAVRQGNLYRMAGFHVVDMGMGVSLQLISQNASGTIDLPALGGATERPVGIVFPAARFEVHQRFIPCEETVGEELELLPEDVFKLEQLGQ